MVGLLQIFKLLSIPLMIILQRSLLQLVKKLMPVTYTTTSDNNHNTIYFSLNHVYWNPFRNIKYRCTTASEIENIIITLKLTNSGRYDEVPSKLLNLCSYYISSPLNYICYRAHFTGVFPHMLKYATVRPLFREGNKDDINIE